MELASTETTQVDRQAEAWFASYAEPADQPSIRQRIRQRRSRVPQHVRHHRRHSLMMLASVLFVGVMTACFYVSLNAR
jgi:hypothetical protein